MSQSPERRTQMEDLYPPIEPEHTGWLEVGDGHRLYFEICGSPRGAPALFLHGGPGSSSNASHRRFFDPAFYRIVLFDQRGCGRSTPAGETRANTTAHLIEDIERLRRHTDVERWLLFGGSWGSTLALAYAQAYPQHVAGLVLRGVFLASGAEVAWYLEGLKRFLPEAWDTFTQGVPQPDSAGLIAHYAACVERGEPAAAQRWSAYESAVMAVGEAASNASAPSAAAPLARVRVQLHYLSRECFLAPGTLMAHLPRIAHLPATLVQGRRDLVCPPGTAYTLAQAWPAARLSMVEEAGHSAMHPALRAALVRATDEFKTVLRQQP
jgi:proline iminopeptidase